MKKFRPLAKSRIRVTGGHQSKQADKAELEGYLKAGAPEHSRALGALVSSARSMGKPARPRGTSSGSSNLGYQIGKQGSESYLGSLGGKSVLN